MSEIVLFSCANSVTVSLISEFHVTTRYSRFPSQLPKVQRLHQILVTAIQHIWNYWFFPFLPVSVVHILCLFINCIVQPIHKWNLLQNNKNIFLARIFAQDKLYTLRRLLCIVIQWNFSNPCITWPHCRTWLPVRAVCKSSMQTGQLVLELFSTHCKIITIVPKIVKAFYFNEISLIQHNGSMHESKSMYMYILFIVTFQHIRYLVAVFQS